MLMNVGPLVISAAHFIHTCVPDSPCQRLHGHNYIVNITVAGEPDACSCMLIDANIVKKVVDAYDHKTIVAAGCVQSVNLYLLGYNANEFSTVVNPTTKQMYILPTSDCKIVDIPATSAEWLAKAIADDIIKTSDNIAYVDVNIAETPKLNITVRKSNTSKMRSMMSGDTTSKMRSMMSGVTTATNGSISNKDNRYFACMEAVATAKKDR